MMVPIYLQSKIVPSFRLRAFVVSQIIGPGFHSIAFTAPRFWLILLVCPWHCACPSFKMLTRLAFVKTKFHLWYNYLMFLVPYIAHPVMAQVIAICLLLAYDNVAASFVHIWDFCGQAHTFICLTAFYGSIDCVPSLLCGTAVVCCRITAARNRAHDCS